MIGWLYVTLAAVCAGIIALVLVVILKRCFQPKNSNDSDAERGQGLQNGIARLHQVSPHHLLQRDVSKKTNYNYLFRRELSTKQAFSWAHHPSLVTDAVENGWSRFAFMSSSPSVKSILGRGMCAGADHGNETNVEICWEVCQGSADFMQKIRLNPNMKKSVIIRGALPLPGPNLGNSCFPQEAYFEVTILSCNENVCNEARENKGKSEGDKIKLIGASSHSHSQRSKIEQVQIGKKHEIAYLGFGGEATLPLRIPGSYPGSIGFNSNGSVYLNGTKLVFESETVEWGGKSDKVIGCGYNPSQKKVFFTVDAQIVHQIYCKTEEFSSPLYPTLAANTDIMVLVNLGQSPFKFAPANLQRTPNPCFIGPLATSPALGDEDSKELFSMGRIDSQWLQRSATRSNNNTVNSIRSLEYDQESEGDLFEIVLDSTGRSPYTTIHH